jgi:plastocyanin/endonuclease YncB( thermonuclease family)
MIEVLFLLLAFAQTYEEVEIIPSEIELMRGVLQNVRISGYLGDSQSDTFVVSVIRPDGVVENQNIAVTVDGRYDTAYVLSWDNPIGRYDVDLLVNGTSFAKTSFIAFNADEEPIANLISISFDSKNIQCKHDDNCYHPQNFYIGQFESVVWENIDESVHTVTSGNPTSGPDDLFDSNLISPGNRYQVDFVEFGTFDYFCSIHPWMIGTIRVSEYDASENTEPSVDEPTIYTNDSTSIISKGVPQMSLNVPSSIFAGERFNVDISFSQNIPSERIYLTVTSDGSTKKRDIVKISNNNDASWSWDIPEKLTSGEYVLNAIVELSGQKQTKSISFDVREPPQCMGDERCFSGKITKIVDGDTLDIDGVRIRLSLVNTPERDEEGYSEATEYLKSLCPVGSSAFFDEDDGQTQGSYERLIGVVYCDGNMTNEKILSSGHGNLLLEFCSVSEYIEEPWLNGKCSTSYSPIDDLSTLSEKDTTPVVKNKNNGGGCLIATAAYGSELSSQVQHLREIRSDVLMTTESGSSFLDSFNFVYYTFSPYIADLQRESPEFNSLVRLSITPMLFSLGFLDVVPIESELSVVVFGSMLIGGNLAMYLSPAFGILIIKNHLKKNSKRS